MRPILHGIVFLSLPLLTGCAASGDRPGDDCCGVKVQYRILAGDRDGIRVEKRGRFMIPGIRTIPFSTIEFFPFDSSAGIP